MSGLSIIRPARATSSLRLCLRQARPRTLTQLPRALHLSSKRPRETQTQFPSISAFPKPTTRNYADLKGSSGKAEADLLVEELQELYEVAKDEFEIATESTDTSTIYAASDRESARDALNQLSSVYGLYTARPGEVENENGEGGEADGDGAIIETNYNPAEIPQGVKDEVRRRVGQRIRELKQAVEALEERAMED
ncbi:unnamed protein product [Penicillium olsonii]|uniref:Uncharacterized protein n=1 Tax=Penicillium olsonii TaxID=99116 RepID=A0A9W4MVW3_PENOL|nr:unnamed protein product [Penicillium olsonii]CAG8207254.1 unnamed protein product [Penicillium olsonii]